MLPREDSTMYPDGVTHTHTNNGVSSKLSNSSMISAALVVTRHRYEWPVMWGDLNSIVMLPKHTTHAHTDTHISLK